MSHHPPRIHSPALYFACLTAPTGVRQLVGVVAEAALHGQAFAPGQEKMGEMFHRDRRTMNRWCRYAVRHHWLRVIRRGRTLTNVYRLARWLWARLTGQWKRRLPTGVQEPLYRLGLRLGMTPERMLGAGVGRRE